MGHGDARGPPPARDAQLHRAPAGGPGARAGRATWRASWRAPTPRTPPRHPDARARRDRAGSRTAAARAVRARRRRASEDLFQLGALLSWLATGQRPEASWRLDGPPRGRRCRRSTRRAVLGALATPVRAERFATAAEAAEALEGALAGRPAGAAPWPLFRGDAARTGGRRPRAASSPRRGSGTRGSARSSPRPSSRPALVVCPTADGRLVFLDRASGRRSTSCGWARRIESTPALDGGHRARRHRRRRAGGGGHAQRARSATALKLGQLVRSSPLPRRRPRGRGRGGRQDGGALVALDAGKGKLVWTRKLGAVFSSPALRGRARAGRQRRRLAARGRPRRRARSRGRCEARGQGARDAGGRRRPGGRGRLRRAARGRERQRTAAARGRASSATRSTRRPAWPAGCAWWAATRATCTASTWPRARRGSRRRRAGPYLVSRRPRAARSWSAPPTATSTWSDATGARAQRTRPRASRRPVVARARRRPRLRRQRRRPARAGARAHERRCACPAWLAAGRARALPRRAPATCSCSTATCATCIAFGDGVRAAGRGPAPPGRAAAVRRVLRRVGGPRVPGRGPPEGASGRRWASSGPLPADPRAR